MASIGASSGARLLRRAVVLLAGTWVSTVAWPQVEWFTKPRPNESGYPATSYLLTRAVAIGNGNAQTLCALHGANMPVPLTAYWKQYSDCGDVIDLVGSSAFGASHSATSSAMRANPARRVTQVVSASQTASFSANSLRLEASIDTRSSDPAANVNRGLPDVRGGVYFRVPDGVAMRFRFEAQMSWSGDLIWNRGGFQLWPLYMKSAVRFPFATFSAAPEINYAHPSGGRLERQGQLGPGVYLLSWSLGNDKSDRESRLALNMRLDFEPPCAIPLSKEDLAAGAARGFGLYGPFDGVDEAAKAAFPVVKSMGVLPTTYAEVGMFILKDRRSPYKYYFAHPVQGGEATVEWARYEEGRAAAFGHACDSISSFDVAATAHTHRPGDVHFSVEDFQQAVQVKQMKSPDGALQFPEFKSIVLFTWNGPVKAFEPLPRDPSPNGADDPSFARYRNRTRTIP